MDVRSLFHRGRRLSVAVVAAALAAVASIAPSSFAVAAAAAQTTGASTATIRGTVTDATGGVLPGVTVTVTSPALQVPSLTALTDETGAYRFIDLRPGVYQISYQLEGFRIVVRENQRLSAGFVAQIDQGLSVSTVAESVVVSGASPVVDVASTGGGTSFSKEVLQQAPVALTMWQVLALSPGIRMTGAPDVGGNTVGTQQGFANYGTSGQVKPELDGMDTREQTGSAGSYYDDRSFEEVQVRAYGHDAEMALPGVNYVAVVKSGGNEFHGTYHGAFQHRRLQSTNLDDDLRAQGLTIGNPIDWYWISLAFAIRSSTGLAAQIVGLPDRGYIRQGQKADIVIFDLERIRDTATIEKPDGPNEGIEYVLVNGQFTYDGGKPTGALPGAVLDRRQVPGR